MTELRDRVAPLRAFVLKVALPPSLQYSICYQDIECFESALFSHLHDLFLQLSTSTYIVSSQMVASSSSEVNDEIVDYLEVKQQLLLSYCINVTFYLYMKVRRTSHGWVYRITQDGNTWLILLLSSFYLRLKVTV